MESALARAMVDRQKPFRPEAIVLLNYSDELYRVARALLRSGRAAERVVLQTFSEAQRSLVLQAPEDLRLLLYRTLLRHIEIEAQRRRPFWHFEEPADPLLISLQSLPLRVAQLLVLADAMELSLPELSFVLRESEPEIARQLPQARLSLRSAMQKL